MDRVSGVAGSLAQRSRILLYAAAAFSLVAALIHLVAMPEHFEEWRGYGTFFLAVAAFRGAYAPVLLRWPRPSRSLGRNPCRAAAVRQQGKEHTSCLIR